MEAAIITTYRCINKCHMCHTWKYPSNKEDEFSPSLLNKLPRLSICNVTGGEPFLRDDLDEIIAIVQKKAKRIVISTNGYLTDKILDLAKSRGHVGIRISIEGLPATNDELRGMKDGFDHGLRTLLGLKRLGMKDIGFGITVSDRNAEDLLELYYLAKYLKVEFATAAVHNSYYFHTSDNEIKNPGDVIQSFSELSQELLKTWRVKNWYRAYFNQGLIHYIQGNPRLLPCPAGTDVFFLDPYGEIMPCNGMEENIWWGSMGNLHKKTFSEIWHSEKAQTVRESAANCPKNCWMIGTASPAMKKRLLKPTLWVLKNKWTTLRTGRK
ncbi:MAG: radical SAM protein [Candidatus Aminicenantes bacterium]|nr:radical SAM protein [Candidatus Aminicenantes bacterium]